MKRIVYISHSKVVLSERDLNEIQDKSVYNNYKNGLTGILIYIDTVFYQVLEGIYEKVDLCFDKIKNDLRHENIIILNCEEKVLNREYPEWSMKLLVIDNSIGLYLKPIKSLIDSLKKTNNLISCFGQSSIVNLLDAGVDPLLTKPRKQEKIILFFDMVAFSYLTKILNTQQLSYFINKFLNIITNAIEDEGGTINKYLGDGVLAYFDASKADEAILSALNILSHFKEIRDMAHESEIEKNMYTGIGISKGVVLEGIIKAGKKADYTIIGKSVNLAQRLEAYTRKSSYCLLMTKSVKESALKKWSFTKIERDYSHSKIELYSIQCDLTEKIDKKNVKEKFSSFRGKK